MNKQLLTFITKNQNKYSYIQLINKPLHIHTLNQQQYIILTSQQFSLYTLSNELQTIHQFNILVEICLDTYIINDTILYLLQSSTNIIIAIYNTINNTIQIYEKQCNIRFNNLKLINVIDPQLIVFNAISILDNNTCMIIQSLSQITINQINEFVNPLSLHRIDNDILFLQTQQQVYKIYSNLQIEPLDLPEISIIKQIIKIEQTIYILTENSLIEICNDNYIIYNNKIQGITQLNNQIQIYYYHENDIIIQSIEGKQLSKFIFYSKISKIQIISQFSFFIINDQQELFLLFYPDYNWILQQNFKVDDIKVEKQQQQLQQKTTKQNQKISQEYLFNLNKASITKQNLDDMITISLKYSYIQLLLLICSRIRIFKEFFTLVKKMSENKNEQDIKQLLEIKKLKKCECIENDLIMEEFIQESLQNSQHKIFIYFQKFFIENPQYINPTLYSEILDCQINRKWYESSNLEIPQIPNTAFKRQINYISFLSKAKKCFVQDLFIQKQKQFSIDKQGMIGNYIQCFECLKPINTQSRNPNETKIIKYQECYHTIHKQCWNLQHECNYEKDQIKLKI